MLIHVTTRFGLAYHLESSLGEAGDGFEPPAFRFEPNELPDCSTPLQNLVAASGIEPDSPSL